jgi:hypothetical protein
VMKMPTLVLKEEDWFVTESEIPAKELEEEEDDEEEMLVM